MKGEIHSDLSAQILVNDVTVLKGTVSKNYDQFNWENNSFWKKQIQVKKVHVVSTQMSYQKSATLDHFVQIFILNIFQCICSQFLSLKKSTIQHLVCRCL